MVAYSETKRMYQVSRKDAVRDNALMGGPVNVCWKTRRIEAQISPFQSSLHYGIHIAIAHDWDLESSPFVNIEYKTSSEPAKEPYTTLSKASDDGSKLRVLVSKVIKGEEREFWV